MRFFKTPSDEAIRIHNESVIMDIHCHPSLKVNLFDYKIYDVTHYVLPGIEGMPSPSEEIFQMQYDLQQMYYGKIDVIWSSVYIVEKGLVDNSSLKIGFWGVNLLGLDKIINSIERDTPYGPYVQALETFQKIETQIETARQKGYAVTHARNFSELNEAINNGNMVYIHSMEGAHMLGRNLPDANEYLNHVKTLYDKGVCSITLGHFMINNICYPVRGISPKTTRDTGFHYKYSTFENEHLLFNGKAVVDLMLDLGMIVDMNHVTPNGRKDVFEINNSRGSKKRPLVFSHNGLSRNCKNEPLCVSDEEVLEIQKCNGVIGVIFMNYWLTGIEKLPDDGIENIIKTIRDIAAICGGSYDNISIGTDMDGFTQPVDDLYVPSQMIRLTQAMLDENISEENIKKVLGGNAMRVLKEGWK